MTYAYLDDFITNPLMGTDKLEQFEQESSQEVEQIGITDEYFKKQLIVYGTYKRAAASLLEAEGEAMQKKLDYYTKEWDRVYRMAKGSSGSSRNAYTTKFERG